MPEEQAAVQSPAKKLKSHFLLDNKPMANYFLRTKSKIDKNQRKEDEGNLLKELGRWSYLLVENDKHLRKDKIMKKVLFVSFAFFFILLVATSSVATAGRFSIGGFVGLNIPIGQKDMGNGTLFGAKGRILLLPFLGVEPNFVFSEYGDKEHKNPITEEPMIRKGGKINSFGVDLVFGTFSGFSPARFYGILGINSNTFKREPFEDQTRLGLSFGSGIEFLPADVFSLEVRARVHAISLEGGGGRENLELTAGLNYYFGPE